MTPEGSTPDEVQARLSRLESQLRWMWLLVILASVLGVVGLRKVTVQGTSGQLEVRSLVMRDAQGQVRAHLGVEEEVAQLVLIDSQGKQRVRLGANGQIRGTDLWLTDDDGHPRVVLGHLLGLTFYGKDFPDISASLSAPLPGKPRLSLFDENGAERATLGWTTLETTATGEKTERSPSSLVLFNKEGRVIWSAP